MSNETSAVAAPEDRDAEATVRPKRLADFVGQERVREQLEVLLHSDGVKLDGCDFGTDVVLALAVRADRTEVFLRAAADQCSGRARVERLGTRYDA